MGLNNRMGNGGLHARLDAKASTVIGVVTLLFAVGFLFDHGPLSAFFLGAAGVLAISIKPSNARGIPGLVRKLAFIALIQLAVITGPIA